MSYSQSQAFQQPVGYQGGGQQQPKIPTAILNECQGAQQIEQRLMRLVHRLHGSPPQAVGQQNWGQDQGGMQNLDRCIEQLNRTHVAANRLLDEVEQLI